MYVYTNNQLQQSQEYNPFSYAQAKFTQGKIFKIPDSLNKGNIIYLRLKSKETFLAPVNIVEEGSLLETFSLRGIVFGFYTGIMAIMFIYNLFLYIIIRDKSYLYYIFYIFSIWLTQVTIMLFFEVFLGRLFAHQQLCSGVVLLYRADLREFFHAIFLKYKSLLQGMEQPDHRVIPIDFS